MRVLIELPTWLGDAVMATPAIENLINFHKSHGKQATLTATFPPGRFGALNIKDNQVQKFEEKPKGDGALINGGYFVLSPKVIELINDDKTVWEQEPLQALTNANELAAFQHGDFWQSMDTISEKKYLAFIIRVILDAFRHTKKVVTILKTVKSNGITSLLKIFIINT